MKRHSIPTLLALALALGGCGQDGSETALAPGNGTQPTSSDRADLEQNVAESPEVYGDGDNEPASEDVLSLLNPGMVHSAQDPDPERPDLPRWLRVLKERERTIVVRIEEEEDYWKAHVRVTDKLWGVLKIFPPPPDPTTTRADMEPIEKRYHDVANRLALYLKRKPNPPVETADTLDAEQAESEALAAHRGRWHLAGISHRRATSPDNTAKVAKVTLITESGGRVEIDEPLTLMRFPRGLPAVQAGEVVTVVARVADPNDLVYLFTRWGRQVMVPVDALKDPGIPAEPGLFAGRFRAPVDRRLFHVGVNAIDRGTLLTNDGPYDSDFWGLLVRATPVAYAEMP